MLQHSCTTTRQDSTKSSRSPGFALKAVPTATVFEFYATNWCCEPLYTVGFIKLFMWCNALIACFVVRYAFMTHTFYL